MDANEHKQRTKQFNLRVSKLVDAFPDIRSTNGIGNQLLRAGPSVGANYRAAFRGRSRPEFIAKLGIAIEEADESLYWMELLAERLNPLMQEADELISILVTTVKTARNKTATKRETP